MTKKIVPIVALALIALIAIVTVIMALVPKSYQPDLDNPNAISISTMSNRVFLANDDNDKETFNKLYNAYEDCFTESSLNALFQGRLSVSPEAKYQEDTLTYLSSLSKYIRFDFNTDKQVTVQDKDFAYRSVIIELVDNEAMTDVKIYLLANEATSTSYYIATIADLGALVSAVDAVKA